MGKYLLYAGIFLAACGGIRPPEGHLYSFWTRPAVRSGLRGARPEGQILKRLGEKKYLVWEEERVVLRDMEILSAGQVASRALVTRIEEEAGKNLAERRGEALRQRKDEES